MTFADDKWLLMLDDPSRPHQELREKLIEDNFKLSWTDSPGEALRALREKPVDLGLIGMGRDLAKGLAGILLMKSVRPGMAVIAISPCFITELVMRLIELDAYSFLVEPVDFVDLKWVILRALGTINEEGDFSHG